MLNTSLWTTAIGKGTALHASGLTTDFEAPELEPIPVYGMSHPSMPMKPYVYGQSTAYARRLLNRGGNHQTDTAR